MAGGGAGSGAASKTASKNAAQCRAVVRKPGASQGFSAENVLWILFITDFTGADVDPLQGVAHLSNVKF
ncbi:MAG: hypothetical protein R6W72_02220 [Desulfurivibrionaceae bacterium]